MLARRHGVLVANCASTIFTWVSDRKTKLRQKGTRARLDRLPFSAGAKPEVWVQLDMEDPKALQYTFSLRAAGEVVLQFQYLGPPFQSPDARARLAAELERIQGLGFDGRSSGRPTLPLANLHDPERMHRFLAIWSDVIDASIRDRTPSTALGEVE
ncbi:MAG: hypothetical protein AB1758_12495 [Candidatus Eremiobacterota bacterium]